MIQTFEVQENIHRTHGTIILKSLVFHFKNIEDPGFLGQNYSTPSKIELWKKVIETIDSHENGKIFKKIPIATKVFGIATIMLLLMMVVVLINYLYLNRVNRELKEIAYYMVPLTKKITQVDRHLLEQGIHLERILQLYEIKPLDKKRLRKEMSTFKKRTSQVELELAESQQLSNEAIHHANSVNKIIEFARLEPYLENLGKEYHEVIHLALEVIDLLQRGKFEAAHILETQLAEEEGEFDEKVEQMMIRFGLLMEQSALEAERHEAKILKLNILLMTIAAIIGLLVSIQLIIGLTRPIQELLDGTKAVETGNLETRITINSRDEVGTLIIAFDKMMEGMRQKEQLKATFGQYVDPRIINLLIKNRRNSTEESSQKVMTVFFSDIAGFSKISELLTAKGLVNLINKYLTLASEPIVSNQGVIDKFLGDAIVAFWGAPFTKEEEHAILGCFAALEQLDQLRKFREMMPELLGIRKGVPSFNIRIGIATSTVIAGQLGSKNSKSYSIIGDAPLVAEALETANKTYGTTIIISEKTKTLAADHIETRKIDRILLPHTEQSTNIYELLSRKGELPQDLIQLRETFEQGVTAYEQKEWEKARALFETCEEIKPDDAPTQFYLKKIGK